MGSPSNQLKSGRLFIHGRLQDTIMGGQLYCRIRAVEDDLVEYEPRGQTAALEPRKIGDPMPARKLTRG